MYRYSCKQFNSALLNMGVLRIGTLHDYRRAEHVQGIADPKEGKKVVTHHVEYLQISNPSDPNITANKDFRALEQFHAVKLGNSKNVTIENCTFTQHFDVPDCFILCTSKLRTQETMNQFEGADSCVEIIDVNTFYKVLTETLNSLRPVIFRGIHEVIYKDREEPWNGIDWGHHPALIKETQFRKQGELWAIWQSQDFQPLVPVILGNYRLGGYCKRIFF